MHKRCCLQNPTVIHGLLVLQVMMQLLWCWWREAATLLSGKINFNLTVIHYIINKLDSAAHDAAVTSQNKVVFKYLLTLKLQKSADDLS